MILEQLDIQSGAGEEPWPKSHPYTKIHSKGITDPNVNL